MADIKLRISVIIPARNEEKVIGHCLDSLTRQDLPGDAFEVILVDNGSTDRTLEVARAFTRSLNLAILQKPAVHVSALRNFGASGARGKILAFLDADCLAPSRWLTLAGARLAQHGVGVVGAHYRIPDNSRWVARAWYGGVELEKTGDISWVPAGDLIVTRSTFDRVGGFDESLQTNEDCEFCERVRAAGFSIIGDPAVAVTHLGTPQTLGAFYRKIRWHATDGLRVFLRELPGLSNARPVFFAFYTLICLVGIGWGVARGISQQRLDVLVSSLLALILPSFILSLRLVWRRKKWGYLLPVTLLHIVFGLARARALLGFNP